MTDFLVENEDEIIYGQRAPGVCPVLSVMRGESPLSCMESRCEWYHLEARACVLYVLAHTLLRVSGEIIKLAEGGINENNN